MGLTGKCKEEFEKWYLQGVHKEGNYDQYVMRTFYSKSVSMQFGVYVDFFDSAGIEIQIINKWNPPYKWGYKISDRNYSGIPNKHEFRTEARLKSIEKANEIYNEL